MAKSTSTSPWRPSNALMAAGILAMKALARLPLPASRAFGKALGTVASRVFPYRRDVALTNLRLCFPDLGEAERRRLLHRHYQAMGMGIFELAAGWYTRPGALDHMSSVTGLEHLEAVRASGRGALLLTAHFTTLEIAGRILLNRHPFTCLYRKPDHPVLAREMTAARARLMKRVIHFDETSDLIRALRNGEFVWYAPDQGQKLKYSALVPFFGVPAVTNTATGRIARMGRAAILPYFGYREPNGHYKVEIHPELTDIPSDDPEADALAINHIFEDFIRKAPEQYFWLHRRFKRRGPGYEDVYARTGGAK